MSTIPQGRLLAAVLLTLALVTRAPAEELRLVFHVTEDLPEKLKAYESSLTIGPYYHTSVIGDERVVYDYQAKRIYILDQRTKTFKEIALHAEVMYKEARFVSAKRQMAMMRDKGMNLPALNQVNLEAVAGRRLPEDRNKPDAPTGLVTPRGDGWFWHHDGRTYVQFLPSEVVVPEACRRSYSQFLLHRCMIHPQARDAIEATGRLPVWLIFEVDAGTSRAFHAFRLRNAEVGEETWTGVPAEYRRHVDPADPLTTVVKQFEKARKVKEWPTRYDLRREVKKHLNRNDPVGAYLAWMEFTLQSYPDRESAMLINAGAAQWSERVELVMTGVKGSPERLVRYLEALQPLERKNPKQKHVVQVLKGMGLDMLGKPREAVEEYTQALQTHPVLPGVYVHLGLAYLNQGRIDLGWRCYEMARELSPDHDLVRRFATAFEERLEKEYPEDFLEKK